MRKLRARARSSGSSRVWRRSRPGPSADASNATNAIASASNAESASTRQSSLTRFSPEASPPVTASTEMRPAAASDRSAQTTLTQPTTRRYGRTRIARHDASRGGVSRTEIGGTLKGLRSVSEASELFDVDCVERFVNVIDENL